MYPNITIAGTAYDTYSLCFLLSFIVVLVLSVAWRPREISNAKMIGAFFVNFSFAFLGAIALFAILHKGELQGRSIDYIIRNLGVAYLGAPILGLSVFWFYCKIINVPFWVFADYVAPFYMLDRVIGRLGCLGYGCCYGIPSEAPWAYTFKTWSITQFVPRHPTQAYAFAAAFAIFLSSRYLYKRMKELPGTFSLNMNGAPLAGIIFFFVVFCYSCLRFFNEFLRAEGPYLWGVIKFSHIALLLSAAISAYFISKRLRKAQNGQKIIALLRGSGVRLAVYLISCLVVSLSIITYLK